MGQTGFFAGREFRTFKELSIAISSTYVIKSVVPLNTIVFGVNANIELGNLRMSVVVGGTEGGSFSETLPILPRNTMTEIPQPPYVSQMVITAGGTHTGGTEIDVLRIKANDNSQFASTVGNVEGDERGIGANTFYLRVQNLSATDIITGVLSFRWEERP